MLALCELELELELELVAVVDAGVELEALDPAWDVVEDRDIEPLELEPPPTRLELEACDVDAVPDADDVDEAVGLPEAPEDDPLDPQELVARAKAKMTAGDLRFVRIDRSVGTRRPRHNPPFGGWLSLHGAILCRTRTAVFSDPSWPATALDSVIDAWPHPKAMLTGLHAFSAVTGDTNSTRAADEVAARIHEAFAKHPLRAVLVYATVNHDQPDILRRLRSRLGGHVPLLGCSVQGVVVRGEVHEGGFALGAMGLGGADLQVAPVSARDIELDTRSKGRLLADGVVSGLGANPRLTLVCWDPQSGADAEELIDGLRTRIDTPIVGGAAGQPFGRFVRTYQYFGEEVTGHAAVALGLAGPFAVETGFSRGSSPTGVVMTLTRSEGKRLIEIDGRPAVDVWREVTGYPGDAVEEHDYFASWAVGVQREVRGPGGAKTDVELVRMAIGIDPASGALLVPTAIPEGARMVLHHRTEETVVSGTRAMARELSSRIQGRRPWAAFGFECCARTAPFLGELGTLEENLELQQVVAPDAPWLGMIAWGEIAPVAGVPAFHNFGYPLAVLAA
jgi:hypothetical protein